MSPSILVARPFLKWAGGKSQLIAEIAQKIPFASHEKFSYIEAFLGGGSVLFYMLEHYPKLEHIVVNDINADIIQAYQAIVHDVEAVIGWLELWQQEYAQTRDDLSQRKAYYYAKRANYNTRSEHKSKQAALLIFLNKTCFNGLYRVNKKNAFNVPIGSYKNPTICDAANLRAVHRALQKVTILQGDYSQVLEHADSRSFIYLDPPYKPLSQSASFTAYAQYPFDDAEQIRLKEFCDTLDAQGIKWLLSNSDVNQGVEASNFFDTLYHNYEIARVWAARAINAKASKRGKLRELLISNF